MRGQHSINNVYSKIKFEPPDAAGVALIALGPSIDKGPTDQHLHLDSGSRLSFLLVVREAAGTSELVSFRFHFHFPEGHSPVYLRFDLNRDAHKDPLSEPLCHLHPGRKHIRVPIPLLAPIEILDRLFFVIEPDCDSGEREND